MSHDIFVKTTGPQRGWRWGEYFVTPYTRDRQTIMGFFKGPELLMVVSPPNYDWDNSDIAAELFALIVGERLGLGQYLDGFDREVYSQFVDEIKEVYPQLKIADAVDEQTPIDPEFFEVFKYRTRQEVKAAPRRIVGRSSLAQPDGKRWVEIEVRRYAQGHYSINTQRVLIDATQPLVRPEDWSTIFPGILD